MPQTLEELSIADLKAAIDYSSQRMEFAKDTGRFDSFEKHHARGVVLIAELESRLSNIDY